MKIYTVPLKHFCSKVDTSWEIAKPFNFGRYTYATDGRIIVRVPIIPGYDRPSCKRGLNVARSARDLFKKFPERGFIAIDIPHKKDVRENGYNQRVVQIGASNFNMVFLLPMKRLPNLKVRPPRTKNDIMPFTFAGGIGKVMPTFASARFTIETKQPTKKGTPHGPPKEKADRDAGTRKSAAIQSRRKRRAT
jgi:hypothetical protein